MVTPRASRDNEPALFHAPSTGGDTAKVVAQRLGHAKTDITNDIYAHATKDLQEQAAEAIDDVLDGGGVKSKLDQK